MVLGFVITVGIILQTNKQSKDTHKEKMPVKDIEKKWRQKNEK